MFLSRLVLNLRDTQARFDVARPYEMHRTLWRAFPQREVGRVLFRTDIDRHGGSPTTLVQSKYEPDWAKLPTGYTVRFPESKPLDLLVTIGQKLRFRLRANPTKRVASKSERPRNVMVGKRVGLVTEAEQIAWLLRKGEEGGFSVPGGWVDAKHPESQQPIQLPNFRVEVIPEGRDRNDKAGHHEGVFLAIRFDGVLEVTNPEKFNATVSAGIGSGKSFGFGLLSVGPA